MSQDDPAPKTGVDGQSELSSVQNRTKDDPAPRTGVDRDQIVEALSAKGMKTAPPIAAALGVSADTIERDMRKSSTADAAKDDPAPRTGVGRAQIVEALSAKGMTTRPIAQALGVDQKTVVNDQSELSSGANTPKDDPSTPPSGGQDDPPPARFSCKACEKRRCTG